MGESGGRGSERRGLGDAVARLTPLGPTILGVVNGGVDRRRCAEMLELGLPAMQPPRAVVAELQELCGYYQRLHPEHAAHWERAREFVTAHAAGTRETLELIARWGFRPGADGRLVVPDWWDGKMILPLEFMDYGAERYPDAALDLVGVPKGRFHLLAKKAADLTWMGYYRVKGRLDSGGVSLLTKEVTDVVQQMKARVEAPARGPLLVYVIGISEDEIAALHHPDLCVIGFNLYNSPILEKLLRNGRVRPLVEETEGGEPTGRMVHADSRAPFQPEGGKCFVCQVNAARRPLPVPAGSGLVMTNYTLHHNPLPDQEAMIREMNRVALPVAGGGRAWVAGEMFRDPHLLRLLVGPVWFCGATSWDAWVSFVHGMVSVENLMAKRDAFAAEGVKLGFEHVPRPLQGAPGLFHRWVMPLCQVLITGY